MRSAEMKSGFAFTIARIFLHLISFSQFSYIIYFIYICHIVGSFCVCLHTTANKEQLLTLLAQQSWELLRSFVQSLGSMPRA